MIIANEKRFSKLSADGSRALENSFVYLLSHTLTLKEHTEDDVLEGNDKIVTLCPPVELLEQFKFGNMGQKKFEKAYRKYLNTPENRFIIYTIVRSLNEKHYMPIFVCTNDEWETGYLKVFAQYLGSQFGLKIVKVKKYLEDVEQLWKDAKKVSMKPKKRHKAFRKLLKQAVKENVQISFDGIKKLEKMEKEFAIDRIAILLNHSDEPLEEVSKKAIISSIESYESFDKKAAKRVKRMIKELDMSKKPERWGKKEAVTLTLRIYGDIHNGDDEDEDE